MRDYMRYVNHLNEVFYFGTDKVLINENTFRNYKWSFNSQYNKITSFERKLSSSNLPVTIVGPDAKEIANRLFEIIEKDVLTNNPGKMYIGDYYISGYFTASNKKEYTKGQGQVFSMDLTFTSDQACWIKESPYVFRISDEGSGGSELGLGYSYDYPFDYSSPISSQNMVNSSFVPVNFVMTVYGPVTNPEIIVGGNIYQVDVELEENEVLVINSREKKVYVIDEDGIATSAFAQRNLDHYIFEKVPAGELTVLFTPECNFDIVLMEERSEPAWI